MKTKLLIFCLTCFSISAYAHQAVSVRDGDFFSDSVWAGNVQPDLSSDSIYILHQLSFDKDIIFRSHSFIYVGPNGKICGSHNIILYDSVFLWNSKGSIYMDSMWSSAVVLNNGYIDAAGIVEVFNPGATFINDSCGEMYVHLPPQSCARSSSVALDTNSFMHQNDKTVTLSLTSVCTIRIKFGDGDSTAVTGPTSVSHTYPHYGLFTIIITTSCSGCDTFSLTQQKIVELDSVIPPYVCAAPTVFSVYPDPSDAYFFVKYESCTPDTYRAWIYNAVGQKIREVFVDNTGSPVKVKSDDMASGIYFIRVPETVAKSGVRKIVVVH